jgi:hypothetical protein
MNHIRAPPSTGARTSDENEFQSKDRAVHPAWCAALFVFSQP